MAEVKLPDNPMEIAAFAELWQDAKNDWDLAFRAGMEKGYQIALDTLNSNNNDEKTS